MSCRSAMDVVKHFFSEVFKRHTEDDAEQVVIVGAVGTIPNPETLTSECPRPWLYTRVFLFFLLTTVLLFVANVLTNPGQFSNVLVIGAFAVPFTVLVLIFEFNVFRNISFYTVLKSLFLGGALSLIVTAILPSFWFQGITSVTDAFVAGGGEEVAKLLVVYWILKRNRAYPYVLNGLLIGAAVGAGFAIFETAGYGMVSFLRGDDNAWVGKGSMFVLALRNLLAPGGHVVWAAISGAGLLLAARREPLSAVMFRRKPFWAAFLVSVVLHVLWDMPFFKSKWWTVCLMLILTFAAWIVVAWFIRRGLEEVDAIHAVVPYQQPLSFAPLSLAGPWRRWAARTLDLACGGIVVYMVLYKVGAYFGFLEGLDKFNETIYTIAVLPLLLLLEIVVYELFGTTFGKWAFSLRVCDSGGKAVSSKVYFKRLLRLWGSGLGLWIPIVSFVTSVVQYRRLSSRGQTSYDEALGLGVVKERIHPLRWIVVLPVLLAVGGLVTAGVLAGDGSEEDALSKTVDIKVAKVISSSDLRYELKEGGICEIGFQFSGSDGRGQSCLVDPRVADTFGVECICVYSLVAPCDSIGGHILNEMLSENSTRCTNLWCKVGTKLALRALVPLDVSPEVFRDALERLAKDADDSEKQFTGRDEF